ncbi:phosphoadenosine phosphosulfate reductase [Ectothiorhodospiraceae bacterium BW-2]|nr:phosphoadenosine phosphosulfate reductase [Ectothiorhodospiraceae bacterium BW-2]
MSDKVRHLLGLSGGKDSSALAIYMRDRVPEMEYFFADTGAELPETLEFIDMLEDFLGKPIVKINAERDFNYYFDLNENFLPTNKSRWCTQKLKIEPFEEYVGDDTAITYVGIRADEPHRKGYISTKSNISARYPFIEDGLKKEDIVDILKKSGIGLPKYYDWRSRSGCYFCFFQRKEEWVGLYDNHPKLFEKAMEYEQFHKDKGRSYTWSQGEYLEDLIKRRDEIEAKAKKNREKELLVKKKKLINNLDDDNEGCLICTL